MDEQQFDEATSMCRKVDADVRPSTWRVGSGRTISSEDISTRARTIGPEVITSIGGDLVDRCTQLVHAIAYRDSGGSSDIDGCENRILEIDVVRRILYGNIGTIIVVVRL